MPLGSTTYYIKSYYIKSVVITSFWLVVLAAHAGGCSDDQPLVTVESLRSSEDADQESWNVDLNITEDGLPRLHLTAPHVLKYERPDSIFMLLKSLDGDSTRIRVRVDIFDESGDSSAVVFADQIYYYERENRFVAEGDVVATSRKGSTIQSEHLEWTEDDRKMRTPGFATIISPRRRMTGYNLEANEDLSNARLERVTGTFEPEDDSGGSDDSTDSDDSGANL
jgi:LPS export ABC transporter protein LptC